MDKIPGVFVPTVGALPKCPPKSKITTILKVPSLSTVH